MHRSVVVFWMVLAGLYLALAVASFCYGRIYDDKVAILAEHFPIHVTRDRQVVEMGDMKLDSKGKVIVTNNIWEDFRAYLNASTWVNTLGFVFAAAAAILSWNLSCSEARQTHKATGG